jgi:hypothetical protein
VTASRSGRAYVSAVPTLDTAAYAAGDVLTNACVSFDEIVRTDQLSAVIHRMVVHDAAGQNAPMELWLFGTNVSASNGSNQIFSMTSNVAANTLGVIGTGPWVSMGSNSVAIASNIELPILLPTTTLYALPVTRGAPTYAVNSLKITLDVTRD